MPMHHIALVFTLLLLGSPASAVAQDFDASELYRIGSEWGRTEVTEKKMRSGSVAFRNLARATGLFHGAPAFFLGRVNGDFVMATNHHVIQDRSGCIGRDVNFSLLGIRAR